MRIYKSDLFKSAESILSREAISIDGYSSLTLSHECYRQAVRSLKASFDPATKSKGEAFRLLYHYVAGESEREFLHLRLRASDKNSRTSPVEALRCYPLLSYQHLEVIEAECLRRLRAYEIEQSRLGGFHPDECTKWERYCSRIIESVDLLRHGSNRKPILQFIEIPNKENTEKIRFGETSWDKALLGLVPLKEERTKLKELHSSQIIGCRFEIDGRFHEEKASKDNIADWILRNYGIHTVRLQNDFFRADHVTDQVIAKIPENIFRTYKDSSTGKVSRERIQRFFTEKAIFNCVYFMRLDEIDQLLESTFQTNFKIKESYEFLKAHESCPKRIRSNPLIKTVHRKIIKNQ